MMYSQHRGGGLVLGSFALALLLHMVALPHWLEYLRPDWMALVLIYWCIALPERVGVISGALAGLALDVASGTLLGQHALTLAIVAYLALRLHQRIRVFPVWQQAVSILLLVCLHMMLALWIKGMVGQVGATWTYWLPAISSMFFWLLVFPSLRWLRRTYHIK
jgi:rod shape-determining protein MreD